MFAPINPASILERKRTKSEFAKAKIKYETKEPKTLISITGLRPILSEILPHIGLKMNCINENEETSKPIWYDFAPKLSA